MFVHFDIIQPDKIGLRRVFFAQYPSYFLESICHLCTKYDIDRRSCGQLVEYVQQAMTRYYGHESGELYSLLVVLRALNQIADQHMQTEAQHLPQVITMAAGTITVSGLPVTEYVDADFIEIGRPTSTPSRSWWTTPTTSWASRWSPPHTISAVCPTGRGSPRSTARLFLQLKMTPKTSIFTTSPSRLLTVSLGNTRYNACTFEYIYITKYIMKCTPKYIAMYYKL